MFVRSQAKSKSEHVGMKRSMVCFISVLVDASFLVEEDVLEGLTNFLYLFVEEGVIFLLPQYLSKCSHRI